MILQKNIAAVSWLTRVTDNLSKHLSKLSVCLGSSVFATGIHDARRPQWHFSPFEIWISTLIRNVHSKQSWSKDICALSSYSTFISMPMQPHWSWHSVRFQSRVFKACLYRREIQEMLHPRNWCLCRWNSSGVTISVKWQQCSPDHCLRDDILLNSISFLIIFSCSIHHLSLFSLWCTSLLFSPSFCPK